MKLNTNTKETKTKKRQHWEYIGECGVDSGQLMVCDPCYIGSEWRSDSNDLPTSKIIYRDTTTEKLWQYSSEVPGIWPFGHYEYVIPEHGRTVNALIAEGIFEKTDIDPNPNTRHGEFSYHGCCAATLGKESAGQLNYTRGHAGAGVVFSSGYGDGVYPVYAKRNKDGRIIEVRIKML